VFCIVTHFGTGFVNVAELIVCMYADKSYAFDAS